MQIKMTGNIAEWFNGYMQGERDFYARMEKERAEEELRHPTMKTTWESYEIIDLKRRTKGDIK